MSPLSAILMDTLRVAHLLLIAVWAGFVLAEVVVELAARDETARWQTARLHYLLDVFIELPLLLGILGTGAGLALRSWPLDSVRALHAALGLGAVAANLYCARVVIRRRSATLDTDLIRDSRLVRWSAAIGVPFGLAAAYIGFSYLF